jgi:DNA polymerase III epsilon subunit-like protein
VFTTLVYIFQLKRNAVVEREREKALLDTTQGTTSFACVLCTFNTVPYNWSDPFFSTSTHRPDSFPILAPNRVSPMKSTHFHQYLATNNTGTETVAASKEDVDSLMLLTDPANAVAIDCEMVGVGPGGVLSVLARVSIVDWHGRILLDAFVKVQERVTDFRTRVSGIRPADLTGPKAMDFGTVRSQVGGLLKGKLLVGHGLINDLKVFHLKHPWYMIRDSATYQPLLRFNGQPRRLKELASTELGLMIQLDGREHDSNEDARAAMALYKRHQAGWDYDIRSMMMHGCHEY